MITFRANPSHHVTDLLPLTCLFCSTQVEALEAATLGIGGSSSGGDEKRAFASFREQDAAAAAATARAAVAAASGGGAAAAAAAADTPAAAESSDAATAPLSSALPPAAMEPAEDVVAAVLQDVNFMEFLRGFPLPLSSEGKIRMIDAVRRDTNFLARGRIMDYSFLIGIDVERHELVVGIIDFLRRCVVSLLLRVFCVITNVRLNLSTIPGQNDNENNVEEKTYHPWS